MCVPAHRTAAGTRQPLPLLELEPAPLAARRLEDEALPARSGGSLDVLEVSGDVALRDPRGGGELVRGERPGREGLTQRLSRGLVALGNAPYRHAEAAETMGRAHRSSEFL